MILTDTGPLIALLDANDTHHKTCVAILRQLPPSPLLTSWICFAEAMYLLGSVGGYLYQSALWRLRGTEKLVLHDLSQEEGDRMAELMRQYQDTPMDLADASLIAIAESLCLRRIFTVDSDFYIYRLTDSSVLEILTLN